MRRHVLILTPYLWLVTLFLVPFLIVVRISLSDPEIPIPPYTPILSLQEGWSGFLQFLSQLDFENYVFLTQDDLYWKAYLSSLRIAAISTIVALFVGFPIAYGMAKASPQWQPTLLILIILPFWTSFLIRVYSWIGILSTEGYLNQILLSLGMMSQHLTLLNTPFAVYVGITYTYLRFLVFFIYASL